MGDAPPTQECVKSLIDKKRAVPQSSHVAQPLPCLAPKHKRFTLRPLSWQVGCGFTLAYLVTLTPLHCQSTVFTLWQYQR